MRHLALAFALVLGGCNNTGLPIGSSDLAGADLRGVDLRGVDLAGGGSVDLAGMSPMCVFICNRCVTGGCCPGSSACCAPGEWCDNGVCHCGTGPGCAAGLICASAGPGGLDRCGSICCGDPGHPCPL